ncbi:EscU/YscU/HrcU family type III secretion system export apparatus switch protein [Trinickia acidisoli]|uniref:EscU/YscU/HrcU family type III secretion system export apparatus switch protein n=1 Tax=Trinickia acidisoli TaxID=2767482 RepID=UPI001A8D0D8E|nr:EscU/YscU/HrcU family type III secretion system export apparatus switch protein [Trinickia acidisoli]
MSDKPLPPTDKRLRDARAEGQVARSEILAGLAALAAATEVAFACVDAGIERGLALHNAALAQLESPDRIAACVRLIGQSIRLIAVASGLVAAAAILGTLVASWACGGVSFAPKAIRPSLKQLNAVQHIKGLFSAKHLAGIALALATAGIVGATAFWQLCDRLPVIGAMIEWQSLAFDRHAGIASLHAFVRIVLIALLVPALLSAIIAKQQHRRALCMSHRDLKDESKQTSGDPHVRARQRALFTETIVAPRTRNTPGKRVVITNPEHFAVLLHYTSDASEPPIVVEKAIDDDALHLTNGALLARVLVFRFRRLARHLYHHGERQAAIPPDCYRAVAIVFRIVEEIETLDEHPSVPIEIDDLAFDS